MTARISDEQAKRELLELGNAESLEPYPGAHTPWRALCLSCGAEIQVRLSKIRYGRGACRHCAAKSKGEKRISEHLTTAEQLFRSAGLEPLEPYPGALKPWRALCLSCGAEVSPRYASIQSGQGGCAYCSGNRVEPNEAIAVMHAAGVEPLEPYPGSNEPWLCRCQSCKREVSPRYASIQAGQGGCAYCANHRVLESEAIAVMLAAGVEPLEPYSGAGVPWRCRCLKCHREVQPRYGTVKNGIGGCAYCGGVARLDESEAIEVMRTAKFEPLEPYPGTNAPWRCKCLTCGRISSPTFSSVKGRGSICAYCSRVKVDPDEAHDLMLAHDLLPLEPYPGSHTPWRCECQRCGRVVKPRYHHVNMRGTICRYCGKRGPDMSAPSVLYLIQHTQLLACKVGVARGDSSRLRQHAERGWELIRLWNFESGSQAYSVEAKVLTWVRDELGLPAYVDKEQMPQGGWSETFGLDAVSIPEVTAHISKEYKEAEETLE